MTWIRSSLLNKPTLSDPIPVDIIKLITFCNQPWIFIGRTDGEAEAPILWPPDVRSWLNGKHPDAEKDWRQEEKGTTEDEMVGWHHWLSGHEFEQTAGDSDGQEIQALQSMGSQRVRHDLAAKHHQVWPGATMSHSHSGSSKGLVLTTRVGNGTHSSIPAWRVPGTEEPGGLQSRGR